jgi:threonine/homoserine/homoserine lactone efflux protein
MAVFFISLMPQFAFPDLGMLVTSVLLGLVFAFITITWLTFYAAIIVRAGDLLRKPPIHRTLEAVTGSVLVILGLRVAAEHR